MNKLSRLKAIMSSVALKITWFFALALGSAVLSQSETIGKYYNKKCVPNNRHGQSYPTTSCHLYLECTSGGHATIKDCKGQKIFNVTSKTCTQNGTPPCKDDTKIDVYQWKGINDTQYRETFEKGEELPIPRIRNDSIKNFDNYSDDKIYKIFNTNFYTLLKTRFLAVEDGLHTFSTKCARWCKLWIRREECGKKELVLEQKSRGDQDKVTYVEQKPFNMTFGTFYYLEVAHYGDGKDFQFHLGVTWPNNKEKKDNIPSVLLRIRDKKQCPKHSWVTVSPTQHMSQFVRPSPTETLSYTGKLSLGRNSIATGLSTPTRFFAPSAQSPAITQTLNSHPISGVPSQTSVLYKPTSTAQSLLSVSATPTGSTTNLPSTKSTTTPSAKPTPSSSPKSMAEDLAQKLDNFLSSNGQVNKSSTHPNNKDDDGMYHAKHVDRKGEEIAEQWSQTNKSFNVSRTNVVVEVAFPTSDYTFPRKNTPTQFGKESEADQIFIPAQALVDERGNFHRRVFSALYLNWHEKMPRYFNAVKTESSHIFGSYELISHVIASTAVPPISELENYSIVIRLGHLRTNFSANVKPLCVFMKWNNSINPDGVWSTEGCFRDEKMSSENISVCRCNHLTHFGILMQVVDQEPSKTDVKALKFITYIGCALSLIAVSLTVLAISCLPGARSERNFIHANLAVAIGLAQIIFLAGIDETQHKVFCTIVAALLHYFLLVAFSWMLIEGIYLHILVVKVFHDHLPKRRFYVTFCWGLPMVVVLLSVNLLKDGYGTKTSCWLSTDKLTIWTFSGPAILVMIINTIILCKVMKEINSLRPSDRRDPTVRSIRYGVRSTIILLPLLGLTWAFGLIYVNESLVVFQYLFTIFNSLQGFFIFLFHCVFNTEVRKAFWRKVDLWFTTHNNPFGNNGQSRGSFKKSKDDPSSTCSPENGKKTPQRNGFSMYSFNDPSFLTEHESRKLSTTTASTCLDPWPHKHSLTPSLDSTPYPSRFNSTLAADDIKYQPIYKQDDAGQKRILPKTLHIGIKVEDFNGNTQSLDGGDCGFHKESEPILVKEASPNTVQKNQMHNDFKRNGSLETVAIEITEKQEYCPQTYESSEKIFENTETNNTSYIQMQPQQNIDEKINDDGAIMSKSQPKPQPTKPDSRQSFTDGVIVGIGGQAVNSGDGTGHVRKIEVNSRGGNTSNITGKSEDLKDNIGTKL